MSRNSTIILIVIIFMVLAAAVGTVFSERQSLQTRIQQGIGSTTRLNELK